MGALGVARTHILRHKRSHRLHQRAGDQHGKVNDLAGNAIAGGCSQTQAVDKGAERQERKLGQKFLQGQRQTDLQEFPALYVEAKIRLFDGKREIFLHQHYNGEHHADSLCQHRCRRSTGSIHLEPGHQQQVARNVDNAGHQHEQQRGFAVAQTAEDGGHQVVCHNKENTAAADADVACGKANGFLRSLHQHRNGPCKCDQQNKQNHGHNGKHHRGTAKHRPDLLGFLLTNIAGNQNRNAHGKLRYHKGDQVQQLAAGRNRRKPRRGAKVPHHQQVNRAICRLQHQSSEYRQHKKGKFF